jgi:hypothetical protein
MKHLLFRTSLAMLMASTLIFGTQVHATEDENIPDLDGPDLSGGSGNSLLPIVNLDLSTTPGKTAGHDL